jgi:hypothetical protein
MDEARTSLLAVSLRGYSAKRYMWTLYMTDDTRYVVGRQVEGSVANLDIVTDDARSLASGGCTQRCAGRPEELQKL